MRAPVCEASSIIIRKGVAAGREPAGGRLSIGFGIDDLHVFEVYNG
jgi:hypothetical protein